MAQLIELRRRIRSVSNTRQTTKAMQMVDGTKLRRAQVQAAKSKAYIAETTGVLRRLLAAGLNLKEAGLWRHDKLETALVVVVASDRGLAGGYNANVINRLKKKVAAYAKDGVKVEVIAIGTHAIRAAGKLADVTIIASRTGVPTDPTIASILPLAIEMRQRYETGSVDKIEIIYTHSISSLQQEVRVHQVWPAVETVSENATLLQKSAQTAEVMLEPSPEEVAQAVLARVFDASILLAIQESGVSEHAMRVVAMRNATDNATDLIDDLTLEVNTIRQAGITQEISEITGAAAAIEG